MCNLFHACRKQVLELLHVVVPVLITSTVAGVNPHITEAKFVNVPLPRLSRGPSHLLCIGHVVWILVVDCWEA